MKAWDYECVGYKGDIYCVDCLPVGVDMQNGDVSPVFESSEWGVYPVCCVCGQEHDYVVLLGAE